MITDFELMKILFKLYKIPTAVISKTNAVSIFSRPKATPKSTYITGNNINSCTASNLTCQVYYSHTIEIFHI